MIREVSEREKEVFDRVVTHPMQSWAWGEFRKKTNVAVERVGVFGGNQLKKGYQVTIHSIPKTGYKIAYFPKGPMPDETQLELLKTLGKKYNCILVKLEPNVAAPIVPERQDAHGMIRSWLINNGCKEGRPLFTKYTFQVDLTKSEEGLLSAMKSKTRYNIGVAQRNDVTVQEENSVAAFENYLRLMQETTTRQGFYAHTLDYHRQMWKEMHKSGIARLLTATWNKQVLVAWVVFVFNGVLYYPYGASSSEHREIMASNLMMWEVMRYGKKLGCKTLDMWGALGPEANPKDPFWGFHRFKEGYGGQLMEFVGTYDLVIKPRAYRIYRIAEEARWKWLKIYAKLRSGQII